MPGIRVESAATNFVFVRLVDGAPLTPQELIEKLQSEYNIVVRAYPGVPDKFRLVVHYWITRERVQTMIEAMKQLLA